MDEEERKQTRMIKGKQIEEKNENEGKRWRRRMKKNKMNENK